MLVGFWHFCCPECGMGDSELGRLAGDQEFACDVCNDEGRTVSLQRRPADELMPAYAPIRLGLAA
jgi:hypothetical protein